MYVCMFIIQANVDLCHHIGSRFDHGLLCDGLQ